MSKPSVILIPGSYCLIEIYQPLIDAISGAGYEVTPLALPTVGPRSGEGRPSAAPSMYDDAAAIASKTEQLADQGKNVVLLGHSYAGVPMTQSVKGLSRTERSAQGKRGGVVHLAYYAALVPPLNESAASLLSRFPADDKPAVSIDEHGWMLMTDPAATSALVCQDLAPEDGERLIRGFAKHSARSFGDALTHPGYRDVPASYLLCGLDRAGPPDFQREMIAMIEQASGGRKVDVTGIQAGHCANVSRERETNEWALAVLDKATGVQ